MACISDTSALDHSPISCCSADSPTSPQADLDSPSPYKSCNVGCYSSALSPPSSPSGLSNSMLNGSQSPPPPPPAHHPISSLPLPGSVSSLPHGGYPPTPSTMLPTPMYSSQDYSSSSFTNFSNSMPSSFSSNSMPSLSMPMWRYIYNRCIFRDVYVMCGMGKSRVAKVGFHSGNNIFYSDFCHFVGEVSQWSTL